MKTLLRLGILILASVIAVPAQVTPPTGGAVSPLYSGLQNAFDLNNTNSLVNASEINITPEFKWNSATSEGGGALNVDWWVTDQQGAFFGFEEYSSRTSYLSLGYQARTVFKGIELSIGLGTRQDNTDPIGDVQMFIRPTITKQIYGNANWDIRVAVGCDVFNAGKPSPFLGVTFRALKF